MKILKLIPLAALLPLASLQSDQNSIQNAVLGQENLKFEKDFEKQFQYKIEIPGRYFEKYLDHLGVFQVKGPFCTEGKNSYFALSLNPGKPFYLPHSEKFTNGFINKYQKFFGHKSFASVDSLKPCVRKIAGNWSAKINPSTQSDCVVFFNFPEGNPTITFDDSIVNEATQVKVLQNPDKPVSLVLEGKGTLSLLGENLYPMDSFVSDVVGEPTLQIISEKNIGGSRARVFLDGGVLKVLSDTYLKQPVHISSNSKLDIAKNKHCELLKIDVVSEKSSLKLENKGEGFLFVHEVDVQEGVDFSIEASVSGQQLLRKTGLGQLILNVNQYSGGTTVEMGSVAISSSQALGSGPCLLYPQTKLTLNPNIAIKNSIQVQGDVTFNVENEAAALLGKISGSGEMIKKGSGILEITSQNDIIGAAKIQEGILAVNNQKNLPQGTIEIHKAILGLFEPTILSQKIEVLDDSKIITDKMCDILGPIHGKDKGQLSLQGKGLFSVSNVVVDDTADFTLKGSLTQNQPIVKKGTGSLTLEVQNATDQPLIIESGAVVVKSNENIGQGKISFINGTLDFKNPLCLSNSIQVEGKAAIVSDFDLDLEGVISGKNAGELHLKGHGIKTLGSIDVPDQERFVIKGQVVSREKIEKKGSGTLIFDCENQSNVPFNIQEGVLEVFSAKALGSNSINLKGGALKVSSPIEVTIATVVEKNSSIQADQKAVFSGTLDAINNSILTLQGPIEIKRVNVNEGKDFSLVGCFSSSSDFLKSGDGTLYLRGDNIFDKNIIVEKGTLSCDSSKAIEKASVVLKDSSFHVKSEVAFDNDFFIQGQSIWISDKSSLLKGTLYGKNLQSLTFAGSGSLAIENIHVAKDEKFSVFGNLKSENFVKTGLGQLSLEMGTSIFGNIEIQEGSILIANEQSFGSAKVIVHKDANIDFVNDTHIDNDLVFMGPINIDSGHNIHFSGHILKAQDITKKGQNVLKLSGNNSISGSLVVEGGLLKVEDANNIGSCLLQFKGGDLEITKEAFFGQKIQVFNNATIFSDQKVVFSNEIEGFDQRSLRIEGKGEKFFSKISVPATAEFLLTGSIASVEVLEKSGLGTLTLDSCNKFPMGVEIKEGNIQILHAEALGKKGVVLAENSILEIGPNLSVDLSVDSLGDLCLSVVDGSSRWIKSIQGKGKDFIKLGQGELVLEGKNADFSKTVLRDGSVKISSISSLGSGPIVFEGGGLSTIKDITIPNAHIVSTGDLEVPEKALVKFLNVEGDGILVKKGLGNVMLPITTEFKGSFVVDEGGVLFTSAGPKKMKSLSGSSGVIRIDSSQEIIVTGSDSCSFHGKIIGSGKLTVDGNTDLCLTGIVQPMVEVNNGCVHVNGACSKMQVNRNGVVKGTGFIQSLEIVNGSLSPGNSIGSITLNSLSFTPQSIFQVEISPQDSSFAMVNLFADLGSATLEVIPQEGSYTIGQQWKILTAGNLSDTKFNPEIKTLDRYNFDLSYTDRDVYLTLLGIKEPVFAATPLQIFQAPEIISNPVNISVGLNGLSGNREHVAKYLNSQSNALLGPSFDILSQMSGNDLDHALDTISPARNSFATFTIQNVGFSLGSMVTSRLFDQRSLKDPLFTPVTIGKNGSSQELICSNDTKYQSNFMEVDSTSKVKGGIHTQNSGNPFNIWGMGLGDFAKQMDQNQTPSFDLDSTLAVLGFDWGNLNQGILGASVAYAHSKFHDSGSFGHGQINSVYGAVYGLTYAGNFFVNAQIWGGYQYIDNLRKINFSSVSQQAFSEHASASFNPHLGIGYDFYLGRKKQFTLEPFMDFDWVNVFENGYQENGNSAYKMKFSSRYSSMLQMETGLNSYWKGMFDTGFLIVKGALSYILKAPFSTGSVSSSVVGGIGSLNVEAFTDVQNIASPSVEVFWQDENGAFASIGYKGEFSYVYISNQVLGKLGYNF